MGVLGIGGIFFRARNAEALSAWYRDQLGVGAGLSAEGAEPAAEWFWRVNGGDVVFQPFKADTDYYPAAQQTMLNFRVSEIDGMIARLESAGVEVITKTEWDTPETGRFARIHDPEGNASELWQPPAS